jgi:hypothetical protein
VIVTVPVEAPEFETLPNGVVRLSVAGFDLAGPAEAPLPERRVLVAVPPTGAVRVRAAGRGEGMRPGVTLADVRGERPLRATDPRLAPAAPPLARLEGVSWMRDQRVAAILVRPVAYDARTKAVRWFSEIEIEVSFDPAREAVAPLAAAAGNGDPFESLYRGLLANYEQGRAWRRTRGTDRTAVASVTADVFAGRRWVRIGVPATGFYKVNFGLVRNLAVFGGGTTTPLDSLRLFSWPGLPVLPEQIYCDSCGYEEVAIGVVNANATQDPAGHFDDNNDYFYFFALGPSDWNDLYDPAQPDTAFLNPPYETRNYFFLTAATATAPVGGTPARIPVTSAPPVAGNGETIPSTFDYRQHFELDTEYAPDPTPLWPDPTCTYTWEKWYWKNLDVDRSFADPFDAPAADITQEMRLRARLWGIVASFDQRDTACISHPLPEHRLDIEWNGTPLTRFEWQYPTGITLDTSFVGLKTLGNEFRATVPAAPECRTRQDLVGVAWFEMRYQRRFEPVANELSFHSPAGPGNFLFRIGPFTAPPESLPRVFDVTDPLRPSELVALQYAPVTGGYQVSFEITQAARRRYRVIREASIQTVTKLPGSSLADAPPTSLQSLSSPARGADYLVIFLDGFNDAAELITAWRKDQNSLDTATVPLSAIYDQYSGGRVDPTAIRNFLRAVDQHWGKVPLYVTLLGDASYDFKNVRGAAKPGFSAGLLPSYEGGFDDLQFRQYATDDWLLNVDNARVIVPDFLGGRLPVEDAASAIDVVRNKIMLYESAAPLGEYRNEAMFIADDNMQGTELDDLDWRHLQQTAQVDSLDTPLHIDRRYVYEHKYPTEAGPTKPIAREEIKQRINDGVLLFNYVGHGSPFKLSDENVFIDSDVIELANPTRLPLFVAASCDIGKFHDPGTNSIGELLVRTPGRGAVAVVSATELAISTQNAALNRRLFRRLFERGADGKYFRPISEALLFSKTGSANSQKYQLMGDAAMRLNLPRQWVALGVWDSAGTTALTTLQRGQTITIKGRVLDRPPRVPGGSPVALDGVASLLVEDTRPTEISPPCSPCIITQYWYKAGPMFRGEVSVVNGSFEARMVVPLEARTGPRGRVRAYVQGAVPLEATTDGVGDSILAVTPGTGNPLDQEGPRITLSFPSGSTRVRKDAVLSIDLSDPSGILITGHTPQNGIIVTVDGNTTNRKDVTTSFRYAADSYQAGSAAFPVDKLSLGHHRIDVSAADNLAAGLSAALHRSSASIDFEIVEEPSLQITRAYLFPNPTISGGPRSGGLFVVDAPGDSVNVLIRLYTVTGRHIRTLKGFGGLGQIQVFWDGLDAEGAELANGVYPFKVHINARDEDGTSAPGQSASTEGRVVIVARP